MECKASKQTAYQDLTNKLVKHHIKATCIIFYLLLMHKMTVSYAYGVFALL